MPAFLGYDRYVSGADEIGLNGSETEQPTAEQLRTFIDNEIAATDENVNKRKVADEFLAVYKHYGYIDNQYNGAQIKNWLQEHNKWHNPTIEDFERAFVDRNEAGLIQLDQKKIQAEQARLLDQRAAEIRENAFDPAKAYTMPMEELERRGRQVKEGWNNR